MDKFLSSRRNDGWTQRPGLGNCKSRLHGSAELRKWSMAIQVLVSGSDSIPPGYTEVRVREDKRC